MLPPSEPQSEAELSVWSELNEHVIQDYTVILIAVMFSIHSFALIIFLLHTSSHDTCYPKVAKKNQG